MTGLAVAIAAVAAAGVVLRRDDRLETAVLAFGRDVDVVAGSGRRPAAEAVVRRLLALRGHGLTDVAGALRAARVELLSAAADERVVVLLSDCLHTTGDPPESALAGIDRLHVLCPLPTPEAEAAARSLAARGNGSARMVRSVRDVAPALTALLG
jgi:hypothetical protein